MKEIDYYSAIDILLLLIRDRLILMIQEIININDTRDYYYY